MILLLFRYTQLSEQHRNGFLLMRFNIIIRNIFKHINFKINRKLNKKPVKIPVLGSVGIDNLMIHKNETWFNKLITDNYEEGTDFLDIGANVGQTLIKFKTLYPTGNYIGIEPNPNCVTYILNLIKCNNWVNTKVIPAGAANESSVLPLYLDKVGDLYSQQGATFIKDYRLTSIPVGELLIPVITTDSVFHSRENNRRISLIKIDVEGAEFQTLTGLLKTISIHRPRIVVEVLPANSENFDLRKKINNKINGLIKSIDYEIHRIIEGDFEYCLENIAEIPSDLKTVKNCNYLLLPK